MTQRFRVAFCGTSGTGKTTLARWLADFLTMPLIQEQIRQYADLMRITNIETPTQKERIVLQCAAYASHCFLEAKFFQAHGRFVADRSVHDYESYFKHFASNGDESWIMPYRRLSSTLPGYTHLFLVNPWSNSTPVDGFRGNSDDWTRPEAKVQADLEAIPGVIVLQSTGINGRKREILRHLGIDTDA